MNILCRILGHKYEHKPAENGIGATFERKGVNRYVCSRCGKKTLNDTNRERIINIE